MEGLEQGTTVYYCDDDNKIRECKIISQSVSIDKLKEGNFSATINIFPKDLGKNECYEQFISIPISLIFDNKHHCGYNKNMNL